MRAYEQGQLNRLKLAVFCATLFMSIMGCATSGNKPDYVAPDFDPRVVEELAVLSVVDHRVDQSKPLKLDGWILPIAEKALRKKGYTYTLHRNPGLVAEITRMNLETTTPEFITALEPASARWLLIVVLEDATSKMTFGSTGNAEMSGYLFDREAGTLSWRQRELARVGAGGLIGMAMKGLQEQEAIKQATNAIFRALPPR